MQVSIIKLGDISQEIRRSIKPDRIDPATPYIGLEHIPRKTLAITEWGSAGQVTSTKLAFRKGEILFGKIRPYFHKVAVAPVNGICSSDTIVISSTKPEYFSLVLGCVSSDEFVLHATQTSQGTKMPRANWKVLVDFPISMPPADLLDSFRVFMEMAVVNNQNLVFQNINLRETRDFLIPKLIS